MINQKQRKVQFIGAIVGCAVGDALGAPLEGKSREEIASVDSLTASFRPYRSYVTGQYTDDTQQTIAIAKSIVTVGKIDGAAIADEFMRLWTSGEIVGAGPVAKRAVERLIAGVPWNEAALPEDLPYNGAAMRASPVGLWNWNHPERIPADAEISSIVTHRHPLAIGGAVVVATAIAYVLTHTEIQVAPMLKAISQPIGDDLPEFSEQIQQIESWLSLEETEALHQIATVSGQPARKEGFGISVYVASTVLMSLYAFLKSPKDYVETVERAIRAGGDVDSTAAISGAISGAYNGVDAIPSDLAHGIKDSDEVWQIAEQLYHRTEKVRHS